jgi:mannose-6-phosphate isomerase-like protein (cupin superfamily)
MPKIIKVDDAPKVAYTPGGKAYRVMLVTEETTGAKEVNMIMPVSPPDVPPRKGSHYHNKRESIFFILQGKGKAIIEGKEYDIEPNTVIYIPPGEKHAFRNTGNTELRMLECFTHPPIPADWVDVPE